MASREGDSVRPARAVVELRRRLIAAGLAPDRVDPWEAWKVFKSFLRVPVETFVDDAMVQFGVYLDDDRLWRAHLYLVRQLSAPRLEPAADTGEPVSHIVLEIAFQPSPPPAEDEAWGGEYEMWSMDFDSLDDFVAEVESELSFQRLLGTPVDWSAVYAEEA